MAPILGMSKNSSIFFRDNYSLVHAPNGASEHSILIYSLNNTNRYLGFSNWIHSKEDMPLSKVRTPEGSMCLALS